MDTTYTPAQVVEIELERIRAIQDWQQSVERWMREMVAGIRTEQSMLDLIVLAGRKINELEALNGESDYE